MKIPSHVEVAVHVKIDYKWILRGKEYIVIKPCSLGDQSVWGAFKSGCRLVLLLTFMKSKDKNSLLSV
jgi:hypothetical protein